MTNTTGKISDDTPATTLTGVQYAAIQSGSNVRVANTLLDAAYQPFDAALTSWAGITRASGFDAWVATPSSANLASLVTDETGSGSLVFATSPTLSTNVTINYDFDGQFGAYLLTLQNSASPAANDVPGRWVIQGKNSAGTTTTYAQLRGVISDPTNGSEDSYFDIGTYVGGAFAVRSTLYAGLQIGSPTGGDKGVGTVNATAVYDDNTLLTCYPFDAYLDGVIDDAKWDALVPDRIIGAVLDDDGSIAIPASVERRQHDEMRKFKARLGTETDPLDIDKYTAHWKAKRHLTSLPNEDKFDPVQGLPTGAWIQRLVETVEIQAIHISILNDRLKALESARVGVAK